MSSGRQLSLLGRLGRALGLVYRDGGQPRAGGQSRYERGLGTSRRLDEDVDELRARVEALERRLDGDRG